jgi:hypothetical protein
MWFGRRRRGCAKFLDVEDGRDWWLSTFRTMSSVSSETMAMRI